MYRALMRTAQQFSDSAYRYVITPTTRILTVFVVAARPEYLVPIFSMDLLQTYVPLKGGGINDLHNDILLCDEVIAGITPLIGIFVHSLLCIVQAFLSVCAYRMHHYMNEMRHKGHHFKLDTCHGRHFG